SSAAVGGGGGGMPEHHDTAAGVLGGKASAGGGGEMGREVAAAPKVPFLRTARRDRGAAVGRGRPVRPRMELVAPEPTMPRRPDRCRGPRLLRGVAGTTLALTALLPA